MKYPTHSPAPANPSGSKIILHQQRAATLAHLMLMVRSGVDVFSHACGGSQIEPVARKGVQ